MRDARRLLGGCLHLLLGNRGGLRKLVVIHAAIHIGGLVGRLLSLTTRRLLKLTLLCGTDCRLIKTLGDDL